jgi:hypothetical protein
MIILFCFSTLNPFEINSARNMLIVSLLFALPGLRAYHGVDYPKRRLFELESAEPGPRLSAKAAADAKEGHHAA